MTDKNRSIPCSIGVICFNEEGNIGSLLDALLGQKLSTVIIEEIIVVSSACTDATDSIVLEYQKTFPQIQLIQQSQREGKSSAINLFIEKAKCEVLVIESGDTIPAEDAIEKICSVFSDYKVGAAGGRPVPVNKTSDFMGYAVHLLWRLHHRMAMISPKLGELIAFRKVMDRIPKESAVDEASIEALIRSKRLRLRYIPDAVIYNKGPENIKDFIKQRRRIQNGHLWLSDKQSYSVSSQNSGILLQILFQEIVENPGQFCRLVTVMILEFYCRILGSIDYYIKKNNPFKWDIAQSTKKLR